ncbi:hypothetical protein DFAR_320006 [Desulfarculales bacterium]
MDTASFSGAVLTKLIKKQVLEFAQNAKKPSSSSMKPTSSGFKSWPSCTPSLSFRETPNQSCPSSWPARTTSPTSSIYRISLPLASRVVARSHLAGVFLQDMQAYLLHHLKIAGVKQNLFSDLAVTAIQ